MAKLKVVALNTQSKSCPYVKVLHNSVLVRMTSGSVFKHVPPSERGRVALGFDDGFIGLLKIKHADTLIIDLAETLNGG